MIRRGAWMAAGLVLGGVIAYACTTDTAIGPDVALDSLYIEPASSVIVLDDTLRLTAIGVDTSGRHFAYTRATWSTTSPEIDLAGGVVIAMATGTATVTAAAGTKTATVMVTIQPKPLLRRSDAGCCRSVSRNAQGPTSLDQQRRLE